MAKDKAGASKRSRPEQPKVKPALQDEIEDAEGIEPTTIEEAVKPRTKAEKAAKVKAEKAPKLTPEQRREKRDAEDRAARKNGGVVRTASGKASARGLACLCGCGNPTQTDDARFISGHDAQFRSRVLKGEQTLGSKESALIRPFYEAGEVIAGFGFEGDELVDLHAGSGEE